MLHRREVGHGAAHAHERIRCRTALQPRQVAGDRLERRGHDVLRDRTVEPVALREPGGADIDAEALLYALPAAEGELRAAAAGVEHREGASAELESRGRRDIGEPA